MKVVILSEVHVSCNVKMFIRGRIFDRIYKILFEIHVQYMLYSAD
jgi:hypothetical protein